MEYHGHTVKTVNKINERLSAYNETKSHSLRKDNNPVL